MKIKTLIVDDEPLAREVIRTYLSYDNDFELIGEATNGLEALILINEMKPDLMFLDIEMPKLTGISLLEHQDLIHTPLVIFTTAYDEFALKAFELNAVDYLLKPFDQNRFQETALRAKSSLKAKKWEVYESNILQFQADYSSFKSKKVEKSYPDKLVLKDSKRIIHVQTKDINLIKGSGDYVEIHWNGKSNLFYKSISDLEQRLDPTFFRRVHKSAIINLQKIVEIRSHTNGEYFFHIEGGEIIKSGRTYRDSLLDLIKSNI